MANLSKKAVSLQNRTTFSRNLYSERIYNASEVDDFVRDSGALSVPVYRKNKSYDIYNCPAAFDIETTSLVTSEGKEGLMYHWQFGLNGLCIIGRTWAEYLEVMSRVSELLGLSSEKRLVVFVRNLSFEFQFMRKWHKWSDVFALSERRPVYAVNELGFEFRCSLILSGYSLEKTGEMLRTYPVKKLVGFLDYKMVRTPATPLTADETAYCVNDIKVDMSYFQELIERDGNVTRIQLTKTGYVRKYCRDCCMYEGSHKHKKYKAQQYMRMMQTLTMEPEEYVLLKEAFAGGFTHANAYNVKQKIEDVHSYDFTSSYPYVMITYDGFPKSKGKKVKVQDKQHFLRLIRDFACVFRVVLHNVRGKDGAPDHIISLSRCRNLKRYGDDNGRLIYAEQAELTVTEVDWACIRAFYDFDSYDVDELWYYFRGHLPKAFVDAVLTLYEKKTTLKGVEGKEDEYQWSKEQLNSCYGMMVTDIVRPEITYGDKWDKSEPDLEESIEKYNNSKRRFTAYIWGIYVTAVARKNLYTGLLAVGQDDYCYSDTDSIKLRNRDLHKAYFEKYNDIVIKRLEDTAEYHGFDRSRFFPKTIKGVEKPIGVWDYEGSFTFKTLGAKRYMTEQDGKLSITVSGVNKRSAVPYLLKHYKDPFEAFDDDLEIPPGYAGKLTHWYADDEWTEEVTDYLGNTMTCHELSSIHLEDGGYSLSLSQKFLDYLLELEVIDYL